MPTPRAPSLLLCLSLLAPACGDSGGVTTDTTATDANDSTDSTINTTDSAPTEVTGSSSDASSTSEPTTTGDSSTTGGSSSGTETDTDAVDESTGTTGEPDPCAGLAAPEPANAFYDFAELFHSVLDQDHSFSMSASDEFDNSWDITFFNLGADEPVVGAVMDLEFVGQEMLGLGTSGGNGKATLEIVSITPDCVTGRISDVVVDQPTMWIHEELPGGFVASRREL